jgi:Tol biopolymer transport system component
MPDPLIDGFDDRIVSLLSAYGDQAVTTYDAAAIARAAVDRPQGAGARFAWLLSPRVRVVLAVAALALLALVAALVVGSRHPSPIGDRFASPIAAAWSPDGATLAFVVDVANGRGEAEPVPIGRPAHPELWLVHGDGGDPRLLTTLDPMRGAPQLAWTPDGRSIVVGGTTADGTGHSAILSVGLDGSAPRTLLDPGADTVSVRGLSPAGDRLLYLRSSAQGADLHVLDLASGSDVPVTTSRTVCCSGSWSPDGNWILYTDGDSAGADAGHSATRVAASDGSERHRLGICCDVGWSGDGRAFFQAVGGPLFSAASDGTGIRVVPDGDAPYGWSASPDGSRYAAVTSRGLEIVRPGEAPMTLTTDRDDRQPMWSPDGAWVAFQGVRAGVAGLYLVPSTGGDPRLATPDAIALGDPWRPGSGRTELTLVRDRAIVTVDAEGAALRDLVARATIAGNPMGPPGSAGPKTRIVLRPEGPDRDIYRIAGRDHEVIVENQSDIAWVPWDLVEKDSYCSLVSGPYYSANPCKVGPHQVVSFRPPWIIRSGRVEIRIGPDGADASTGFPVVIDLEAEP